MESAGATCLSLLGCRVTAILANSPLASPCTVRVLSSYRIPRRTIAIRIRRSCSKTAIFAHSSTWVRVAKRFRSKQRRTSVLATYGWDKKQRIETYERSIKGDRLQLADPANFIHGELSRVARQWTPFRLIVRTRKKDRGGVRSRAHAPTRATGREGSIVRYTRKILQLLFDVITYCARSAY